jgi:hypothetical protein
MQYKKSGYKKEDIDGLWEDGKLIDTGLADLSCQCIKSMLIDKLEANRQLLTCSSI